jgi:glycerol-3-phosphate dehydrogenase subunit C
MTITHDPTHPAYAEEADVRDELSRVFGVCDECRRCTDLCGVFPSLFDLVERHQRDPGRMTPAEQDSVIDKCLQCKLCLVGCPFAPDRDAAAVDIPRSMLRAEAMRAASDSATSARARTVPLVAGSRRIGTLGVVGSAIANRVVGSPPGSRLRRTLARTSGISAERLLPPFARQRFSSWFRQRLRVTVERPQARVSVLPACLVEYHDTTIGHDLVKVYERNGIDCELSDAGCCGAPWLHAGKTDRFVAAATRNIAVLAAEVAGGRHIVVPQPTCSYVVRRDYPVYLAGTAAELVAANTFDPVDYLMRLHDADDTTLDTNFDLVADRITYHAPCHVRAQEPGLRSRDLLRLTGARVDAVRRCSGTDGSWGLQVANEALAMAASLAERIESSDGDLVAGDCHLANTAITEQTGRAVYHPLQVLARAYGIPPEP